MPDSSQLVDLWELFWPLRACHPSIPEVAIQGAVLDGLGDMLRSEGFESCQIGQGASHLEEANNALLFA